MLSVGLGRGRRGGVAAVLLASSVGATQEPAARSFDLTGGSTLIGQTANDRRLDEEITASFDLFLTLERPSGKLWAWVEAAADPWSDGLSDLLPEVNADAGTVSVGDGDLRLQLSELKYIHPVGAGRALVSGLLDVTAHLDTTRIGNDENMQFLGANFVNNPAIEFPDYTVGMVLEQDSGPGRPALRLALCGSNGLGDNPDGTYGELFDLTADGKGVFAGVEAGWTVSREQLRLGAWANTAEGDSFGAYLTLGHIRGRHAGNLRLGAADSDAADPNALAVSRFASLAYQLAWSEDRVLGIGAARSWSSDEIPAPIANDSTQIEIYFLSHLGRGVYLTPSIQYVENPSFDATSSVRPRGAVVASLRLHHRY